MAGTRCGACRPPPSQRWHGAPWAPLRDLVEGGRSRELVLTRVDGAAVAGSAWQEPLEEAGFVPGYRGHVLRPRARD